VDVSFFAIRVRREGGGERERESHVRIVRGRCCGVRDTMLHDGRMAKPCTSRGQSHSELL
jgi:hypothetical protein